MYGITRCFGIVACGVGMSMFTHKQDINVYNNLTLIYFIQWICNRQQVTKTTLPTEIKCDYTECII